MSDRKHTPDVLAEILTGDAPASELEFTAPAARAPRAAPRQPRRQVEKAAADNLAPLPKPARHSRPTTWEYQVASFQPHNGWRVRYIDGQEVKDWAEGLSMNEFNAYAGEHGWELSGACSGTPMFGRADTYQLFYKRAKAE